jgi:hypothetical protein
MTDGMRVDDAGQRRPRLRHHTTTIHSSSRLKVQSSAASWQLDAMCAPRATPRRSATNRKAICTTRRRSSAAQKQQKRRRTVWWVALRRSRTNTGRMRRSAPACARRRLVSKEARTATTATHGEANPLGCQAHLPRHGRQLALDDVEAALVLAQAELVACIKSKRRVVVRDDVQVKQAARRPRLRVRASRRTATAPQPQPRQLSAGCGGATSLQRRALQSATTRASSAAAMPRRWCCCATPSVRMYATTLLPAPLSPQMPAPSRSCDNAAAEALGVSGCFRTFAALHVPCPRTRSRCTCER